MEGDISVHPVYVVISQRSIGGPYVLSQYALPRTIIDVIEADIADIQQVYEKHVYPLQNAGGQYDVTLYTRESDNPFRAWRHRPHKQETE